jgi:CubicO group peptidase (beta-lactamase class C family)
MPRTTTVAVALAGVALTAIALTASAASFRPDLALRAATATVARTLCDETFVSGLDPDQSFKEIFTDYPGVRILRSHMRRHVDRTVRSVTVSLDGLVTSRAIFHDGYGCDLEFPGLPGRPIRAAPASFTAEAADPWNIAGPAVVTPTDPRLVAAMDEAFAEHPGQPQKATKAVIIVHDGKIVAERYAPGYGPDTPLRAFSVSKSVTNALIGILVREGRLKVDAPAPVATWANPADPRHAITVEQLMRMTSGLALDETNDGFDPTSRMQFTEPDMAAFAERQPLIAQPGARWAYSSPSTVILSRIIRDAVGGHAEDVNAFAERELFAPLGMRHVTLGFDSAGTPVGSTEFYASARDWARFGLLYANNGVVDGRRILPEGWAAYSASTTPLAEFGYGAGFWTNLGGSRGARKRVAAGMPADSFFASGSLGQRVIIAPAERLVIIRFGRSMDFPEFDAKGMVRLTAEANENLNGGPVNTKLQPPNS